MTEPVATLAPSPVALAQADLDVARASEAEMALAHERASVQMEEAGAACLKAHASKVEGAVLNKLRARERLDVGRERLAVAQARTVEATRALEEARVGSAKVDLICAEVALDLADVGAMASLKEALQSVAQPLASVFEKQAARDSLITTLSSMDVVVRPGTPGPVVRALKIHRPDVQEVRAAARDRKPMPGTTVDLPATLVAVLEFLRGEPARAIEAAAQVEERRREQERSEQEAALRGDHGPEARAAAMEKQRRAIANFYGQTVDDDVRALRRPTDPRPLSVSEELREIERTRPELNVFQREE